MKYLLSVCLFSITILFTNCENEPIGKADSSQVIQVNSELNSLVQKVANNDFENEITNEIDHYLLTKGCYKPCKKFLFEECETELGSGSAVFDLENYFDCFFPFTGISDATTVSWIYYETYKDIIASTKPITNLQNENSINSQIIYIRFDNINIGLIIASLPIILKTINC